MIKSVETVFKRLLNLQAGTILSTNVHFYKERQQNELSNS